MSPEIFHEPVLVKEVIEYLAPKPGSAIYDLNLGHGGHTIEILKQLRGGGLLVGVDIDSHALEAARRRIAAAAIDPAPFRPIQANHADLLKLPFLAESPPPDGILLDLGPSTPQLLDPKRGFSWESDEALDMRLSPDEPGPTAADIVNEWDEDDLTRLFQENAGEKWSRRIAQRIGEARRRAPIRTGRALGEIVAGAIPRKAWPPKTHPATRVFMALRIAVNREYERLESVLPQAVEMLKPGGRLVVISFHSGEDERVKHFMRRMATPELPPWPLPQKGAETGVKLKVLTPKPVFASEEEVARNPRSRSARLRAAEKI